MGSGNYLISALRTLSKTKDPVTKLNYLTEKVFESVYTYRMRKVQLNKEERETVGPLIKDNLHNLDNCAFSLGLSFDQDRGNYNLILRSGIQFILDDFKEFPVSGSEELGDSLKQLSDSESLQSFDEALADWKKYSRTTLENISYPASSFVRPDFVSESHSWWFNKCKFRS